MILCDYCNQDIEDMGAAKSYCSKGCHDMERALEEIDRRISVYSEPYWETKNWKSGLRLEALVEELQSLRTTITGDKK